VGVRSRYAEELGDHQHRQRLGVPPDQVEAPAVDLVEQLVGQLAYARPQPLDVPACER
jgi:hypothetical protein